MCLYPRLMKNRKYTKTKKNGGNIPPIPDERVKYVAIGCQDCIECRKQKAREWTVRLLEDIRFNKNGRFVTFTFSNESIKKLNEQCKEDLENLEGYEYDNRLATLAVRLFLERWRKQYKKSLRHWLVTELGHEGTENVHIHGIVWTNESMEAVEKHWQYGFVWKGKMVNGQLVNYVGEKTVNYIVKYIHKVDVDHKYFKSKVLTSAGIGRCYMIRTDAKKNEYKGTTTDTTYRTRTGHKIALPIYLRNKVYSEDEREKLWLHMLDKQERWVCGERIDISVSMDDYYGRLNYYRRRNTELGYGSGVRDWEKEAYEKARRNMLVKQRIEAAKAKEEALRGGFQKDLDLFEEEYVSGRSMSRHGRRMLNRGGVTPS